MFYLLWSNAECRIVFSFPGVAVSTKRAVLVSSNLRADYPALLCRYCLILVGCNISLLVP